MGYNGRLVRVINLLSEGASSNQEGSFPSMPPAAPAQQAQPITQVANSAAPPPALPKEVVEARFRELVAAGMDKNDAATRAIQEVRAQMASGMAPAAVSAGNADSEQLRELAAMGFTDEERNRTLI